MRNSMASLAYFLNLLFIFNGGSIMRGLFLSPHVKSPFFTKLKCDRRICRVRIGALWSFVFFTFLYYSHRSRVGSKVLPGGFQCLNRFGFQWRFLNCVMYTRLPVYARKGTFVTKKKGGIHFKFLPELIKIEIWLDLNDGIKSLSFREIIWKVCRNKIT
jgi:hypothetical protein